MTQLSTTSTFNLALNGLYQMGVSAETIMKIIEMASEEKKDVPPFEYLNPEIYQMYTNTLFSNLELNYKFMSENYKKLQFPKYAMPQDLFHVQSITKAHQSTIESFTRVTFINENYLVSASDDGYVKIFMIQFGFLKLIAILAIASKEKNLEWMEANDKIVVVQYGAEMTVFDVEQVIVEWDQKRTKFNESYLSDKHTQIAQDEMFQNYSCIVIEPLFTSKFSCTKYEKNQLCSDLDKDIEILHIIKGNKVIFQSQSQILLIDPYSKIVQTIFKFSFPNSQIKCRIGWCVYRNDNQLLIFTFCVQNEQYVGFADMQHINKTPWSVFINTLGKFQYSKLLEGQIGGDQIKYVQIELPAFCHTNKKEPVSPSFLEVSPKYIFISYENMSHMFVLDIQEIESKFRLLQKEQLKTPQRKRVTYDIEMYSFYVVSYKPYALRVDDMVIPDILLDNPIFTTDNIKVTENNILSCDVKCQNGSKYKKYVLFFDINEMCQGNEIEYNAKRMLILSGFGGAGLQSRLYTFPDYVTIKGQQSVHYLKQVWIIDDAYSTTSLLSSQIQSVDMNGTNQLIEFQSSDHIIYVLSDTGDDVLSAIQFPNEKIDCQYQYCDLSVYKNLIACTNNFGYILLISDLLLNQNLIEKYSQPTNQFFIFETVGFRKQKFSQSKYIFKQMIPILMQNQKLLNEDNCKMFLAQLLRLKTNFSITTKDGKRFNDNPNISFSDILQLDAECTNQLILVALDFYFRFFKINVSHESIIFQQLTQTKIPLFYFSSYHEILMQLLSLTPPQTTVNARQVINLHDVLSPAQQKINRSLSSNTSISKIAYQFSYQLPIKELEKLGFFVIQKPQEFADIDCENYIESSEFVKQCQELKIENKNIRPYSSKYLEKFKTESRNVQEKQHGQYGSSESSSDNMSADLRQNAQMQEDINSQNENNYVRQEDFIQDDIISYQYDNGEDESDDSQKSPLKDKNKNQNQQIFEVSESKKDENAGQK